MTECVHIAAPNQSVTIQGVFEGRPVIGIAGGIGSGKSFVAKLFAEFGCLVIDSDEQINDAYQDPQVRQTLRQWWGDDVLRDDKINRSAIARKVFNDPEQRRRLEALLHPLVNQARIKAMRAAAKDSQVVAFVWDTPLLFEAGLHEECDPIVYVEASPEMRLERLGRVRGWDGAELARRENLQWPLDKKREISDYLIANTTDADDARGQVRNVLSRILAGLFHSPEKTA